MTLSERAVRRPVTTCMVFVAVIVLGAVSLSRLAIDLLPEVDFPAISVFSEYEGVAPEEMETLITRPIEEAVSRVQGIDRIEAFSAEGRSTVSLRFAWGTSLDSALNDVRAAIERIRDDLPEDARTPVVFKFDLAAFPIVMLTLSGDMEPWKLRKLAEETLSYRLERVEGVAAVGVRGGDRREIHVDLDAERLSAHALTAAAVAEAIRRENVNLPAGDVRERGVEVIVRTKGEFERVGAIDKVVVAMRDGAPVRVRDLGQVRDGVEKPVNSVLIDGKPGIRLAVSKLSGANTVEVAERVRQEVARINRELPRIELAARFDTSTYIEDSITNVEQGVLFGASLAILVLLLFLPSVRATAIVAIAIPIAGVGTFALMYQGGNIQRHRERGLSPKEAAVRGSSEVATAIIASTLTTLSIFVPVIFVGGFAGIFFGQMAYVVSFALLCSLAVALTLVPVLASWGRPLTDVKPERGVALVLGRWLGALEDAYARLLRWALSWRKTLFALAAALFAGALYLGQFIGTELMAEGDQGEVRVRGELPVGTPLERSAQVLRQVGDLVSAEVPETAAIMGVAGPRGFYSSAGANVLDVRIGLVELGQRQRSADDVAAALRRLLRRIPDLKTRVRAGEKFWLFRMLRGGGERLAVNVLGYDLERSAQLAREVAATMATVEGVVDVDVDRKEGNREAVVKIDADKAADLGLSVGQIGSMVSTYVLGRAATYFRDGGDEYRILVRLDERHRRHAAQLERLPIITPRGERVVLADVAHIERREGPIVLRRLNQERIITVSAGFADRDLGAVTRDVQARLDAMAVPEGFTLSMGGEQQEQARTFGELAMGLLLALVLVYMIMAALFESLLHPFVMLLTIPFALVGVVATLLLTDTTLNVNSFLGGIVLVGVVVNNAIVLVDYINLLRREQDRALLEAVVEAGRRRLRPILMTTLTTSLALMPVAIGMGEGGELQAPLARVVVGGLLVSTVVSLLLVPALYYSVEALRTRWGAARSA